MLVSLRLLIVARRNRWVVSVSKVNLLASAREALEFFFFARTWLRQFEKKMNEITFQKVSWCHRLSHRTQLSLLLLGISTWFIEIIKKTQNTAIKIEIKNVIITNLTLKG